MKGLKGKRVVITGGASGIGAATVVRFIEELSHVVVVDRDEQGLGELAQANPSLAGTIVADVADYEQVVDAFKQVHSLLGGLDILINNAGISIRHDDFLAITPEEWNKVIGINLNGVFYVAQQAARLMTESGSGVIVNMGSTNGLVGYRYYADYNASKAGVIELTRSMALELAPKIRVNVVCPGYIMTPMQKSEYTQEMIDELNEKLPLKRHGTPEEVASLFAFLASDEAAYLTGQVYLIDGGEVAGGLASR